MANQKKIRFRFEISIQGLIIAMVSALMFLMGLFLFMSIITERLSFAGSPYPRQDRAMIVLLSWVLISLPFFLIAPNKTGITSALGICVALYLSFAYTTGSIYVFDSSDFMDIAIGMKILIAPIFFIVVLVVLLYNAVSGQEFFRSVIFGGVSIGFLALGAFMGIL